MFFQEIRYALRVLGKKPGFTVIAVLVLALGIGANTAIFSVVYSVLWKSLPFKDPDRLVMIWNHNTRQSVFHNTVSPLDYRDYRDQNDVFADLAANTVRWGFTLTGTGESESIFGFWVSSNWLKTLGVEPLIGRGIRADEDQVGGAPVALIGYGFWKQRLGGDPQVLERTIALDGTRYPVIGVMPAGFRFIEDGEVYLPLQQNPIVANVTRSVRLLDVVGRLKPGVAVDRAQTSMKTIAARLESQYPDMNTGFSVHAVALLEEITGSVRPVLFVLLAAVGVVLLIACANVANLMLVRAVDRQREVAVRSALGAGLGRLIRQFLIESVLVSMMGAAAGSLLAYAGIRYLVSLGPNLPRLAEIRMDLNVLWFTLAVAAGTGLVFGLIPAVSVSRRGVSEALKEGGRAGTSIARNRIRKALLIAEVALALVLLVGSGLLVRSFSRLLTVDPGYATERLLYVATSLPPAKYPRPEQRLAFYLQLEEKLKSIGGVESVGAVSRIPLSGAVGVGNITTYVNFEVRPKPAGQRAEFDYRIASTGYFETMGIPLLRGRPFDSRDSTQVAIINELAARRFFPGEEPVGQRIQFGTAENAAWITIVGVVGNVRHLGLDVEPRPEVYRPYPNNPLTGPQIAIRTTSDPQAMIDVVRSEIHALDSDLPLRTITVDDLAQLSTAQRRFAMLLLGGFAGLAMVLATVGIYGLVSYTVTQRTHEIGLRMALGARAPQVLGMVVGEVLIPASIGVGIGLIGAAALTRMMSDLLFGITNTDPLTYVAVSTLLAGVSAAACYLPARRAARVDPLTALRHE